VPVLERLQRDVAFAFRLLRRNRAWATVGILPWRSAPGVASAAISTPRRRSGHRLPVHSRRAGGAALAGREQRLITHFSDYGIVEGAFSGRRGEATVADALTGRTPTRPGGS
jgi:hypothetical protein